MHYTNIDGNALLTKSSKILCNTKEFNLEVTPFCVPTAWKQDQPSHCSPCPAKTRAMEGYSKASTGSCLLKHILSMHKPNVYVPTVPTTTFRKTFQFVTERIVRYLSWAERNHIRLGASNKFWNKKKIAGWLVNTLKSTLAPTIKLISSFHSRKYF